MNAPATMPADVAERIREVLRGGGWEHARSARYADAPHRYLIFYRCDREAFEFLKTQTRQYGEWRTWRGSRFFYLFIDDEILWLDWPALNRAAASTLTEPTNR
jgi:hypothetical protein